MGVAQDRSRELVDAYRVAADHLLDSSAELIGLVSRAGALLGEASSPSASDIGLVGIRLREDAYDLERRADFLARTDGLAVGVSALPAVAYLTAGRANSALRQLHDDAQRLTAAETAAELIEVIESIAAQGGFGADSPLTRGEVSDELLRVYAVSLAIAIENGWWADNLPHWLTAGVIAHGDPDDNAFWRLASHTLDEFDGLGFAGSPNPFLSLIHI